MKKARDVVDGPFSIMQGYMNPPLTNDELLSLGINLSWFPSPTHTVSYVAMYDFIKDYMARGTGAWTDFQSQHKDNPYMNGALKVGGSQVAKQRELEERYLSRESLEKYRQSAGRG